MFKLPRRHWRTVFLAFFAAATFVGCAIYFFDVDPKELGMYFVYSVLALIAIVVPAAIFGAVFFLLRKLLSRE